MKKLIILMLLAVNVFTACKQQTNSLSIETLKGVFNSHSLLFSDEELPQTIDINMDISQLSYQELRILRYYPYAIKGIWIKEGDINSFYCSRAKWYYQLCDSLYWGAATPDYK